MVKRTIGFNWGAAGLGMSDGMPARRVNQCAVS